SFIEFPDNQDCLDLIEHRVSGILAMVDDECRLPAAKDEKLAARMYKAYEGHGRFSATPTQRRDFRFCVRHYAGAVVYSALSFVEKNKDELPREATALLQGSSVPLLCNLFSDHAEGGGGGGGVGGGVTGKMKSPTVGAQFKEQLQTLMESVYATTPHYIRCLKPNDENVSDNFSRLRITEQLRYGGVLEAVRVARSGFPVRLAHLDFYARYRPLANPFSPSSKGLPAFSRPGGGGGGGVGGGGPGRALIEQLIDAVWDETVPTPTPTSAPTSTPMHSQASELSQWGSRAPVARQSVQLGLTKVFLRKPAHDMLESRRSRRIAAAARRIQCAQRGRQGRAWYCSLLRAVRLLQRVVRGLRARCRARDIRERRAAVKLQRQVRRYAMQWRYVAVLCGVLRLQARARGVRGRALAAQALLLRGAVKLQRMEAARDVGRLRQSNEALKSEIDALRARAAEESENRRVEGERVLREQMEEDKREQLGSLQAQLAAMSHALAEERAAHSPPSPMPMPPPPIIPMPIPTPMPMHSSLKEEGGIASGRDGSGGSGHRSRTNSDSPSSLPSSASPAPTGSAPSSRRSSRAIERRRSAASPTPAAMGGGGGGGGGVGGVYMLDPVLLSESLEREVQAREALEGEVARLRSMCLDYQAQMGA
ncbi:P-loop containing nucleoside triphosphate hydrolase protein, partial [Ochromonadaceae sp. CCMP2298]